MTESDASCSPEHGSGLPSITHHCILHAVQAIAPRKGISEVRRRGWEKDNVYLKVGGTVEPLNSMCQQVGHRARQTTQPHFQHNSFPYLVTKV